MLEDLIVAAINDARAKADTAASMPRCRRCERPAAAAGVQAAVLGRGRPLLACVSSSSRSEGRPDGMLGAMQDFPLRIMRLMDHAEREHGGREIVAARADGSTIRTNWSSSPMMPAGWRRRWSGSGSRRGPGRDAGDEPRPPPHRLVRRGRHRRRAPHRQPAAVRRPADYIVNHAEDRVLLYDRAFAPMVERLKPRLATVEHYICFDDEFDGWIGAEDGDYRWIEGDERDPCGLCYTSGTTGNPKGVIYEHRLTVIHAMSKSRRMCSTVGLLGRAADRADVPRQQLVLALRGGDRRA